MRTRGPSLYAMLLRASKQKVRCNLSPLVRCIRRNVLMIDWLAAGNSTKRNAPNQARTQNSRNLNSEMTNYSPTTLSSLWKGNWLQGIRAGFCSFALLIPRQRLTAGISCFIWSGVSHRLWKNVFSIRITYFNLLLRLFAPWPHSLLPFGGLV